MEFPEAIVCHGDVTQGGIFKYDPATWQKREAEGAYGVNLRHCSYCGSLHPEDLLTVLEAGAKLELSDMKYGWPHKFYVRGIVNPKAGEIVKMGSEPDYFDEEAKRWVNKDKMSPAPRTLTKKFYNTHLLDLKGTPAFDHVTDVIAKHLGIVFFMKEDQMYVKRAAV